MLEKIKSFGKDLYQVYQNWQEDAGSHLAASVSFFMAVSLFPLLLVLISVTGLLLRFSGWGQNTRQRLLSLLAEQTSPSLAMKLDPVLSNVEQNAAVGGPIGLLMLLIGAIVVFVHFDDAMAHIWNVPKPEGGGILGAVRGILVGRLRAFLMLVGIGIFVILGFVATMTLTAVGQYAGERLPMPEFLWSLLTMAAAVGLNWALFTVIYRFLPKVDVRWGEAGRGALFAAIMWEIGRRLLAAIVIGSRFSVYGVVGAFIAIMLWTFYAISILFLGAEYIQLFCAHCNPDPSADAANE